MIRKDFQSSWLRLIVISLSAARTRAKRYNENKLCEQQVAMLGVKMFRDFTRCFRLPANLASTRFAYAGRKFPISQQQASVHPIKTSHDECLENFFCTPHSPVSFRDP